MDLEPEIHIVKIGNASYWQLPDGRLRGVIQGGADGDEEEEEEEEDEDEDEDEDKDKGKKKEPRQFSQRAMRAISTREKRQGKQAGRREMIEELGFKSPEELKEALAGIVKDGEKKDKEADKKDQKTQRLLDEAERDKKEAKQDRFEAKLERQLMRAGAKLSRVGRVVRLLDLEVDAGDDEVEEAIDKLRDEFPELFNSSDSDDEEDEYPRHKEKATDGQRKQPDTDNGKQRRKPKAAPPEEQARAVLERLHPQFAKDKK